MPLKSHKVQPPGGLIYVQHDNAGNVIKRFHSDTKPMGLFCKEVFRLRSANGYARATLAETIEDVDAAQCERLGNDSQWCGGNENVFFSLKNSVVRPLAAAARAASESIKNLTNGAKTLFDWSDSGFQPVAAETAQNRADICTGRTSKNRCEFNQRPKIKIPDAVADIIKIQIQKKSSMKLSVHGEDDLEICACCGCFLKLKVWTPPSTILNNTPSLNLEKHPDFCWMKTESKQNPV